MPEITVTLPLDVLQALMKAAELAQHTANTHADMLNAHAPEAAEKNRALAKLFGAGRGRLVNAHALAKLRAPSDAERQALDAWTRIEA